MKNRSMVSALFLLLAVIVGSAASASADPWYKHYEEAEKALEAENWTEAIDQINEAIERKGDSGARVRSYGMKIISYFPYLKLGIAYYQLGQFRCGAPSIRDRKKAGSYRAIGKCAPRA